MSDALLGSSAPRCEVQAHGWVRRRHPVWIAALVTIIVGWLLAGTARADVTEITLTLAPSPATIVADGTTQATATATVTGTAPLTAQTVTFNDLTSATVPVKFNPTSCATAATTTETTATCDVTVAITGTVAGAAQITASTGTVTSVAQTLTLTAGPATTITLGLNPTSILADGVSTTTATATVADAHNNPVANQTVVFTSSDTTQVIGPTTTTGTSYTATITSTKTVPSVMITATDGALTASQTLTQTLGPAAAATVTLNPAVILANGTDMTTATVTITDALARPLATEAGITFSSSDGAQKFIGQTNNGNGTYSVQIRGSTTVGKATITVLDGAISGQATLEQTAVPSTTSLAVFPKTVVTNQSVTLFAAVYATPGPAWGTVTFQNGAAPISGCVGVPITSLAPTASCQATFAAATGPLHLRAVFTPDAASPVTGSSAAADLVVSRDSASVALAGPATATAGHGATYTATVSAPSGPVRPSGVVEFLDNGQPIPSCTAQRLDNGAATCTLTYKSPGTHSIAARYMGDANFTATTSATQGFSVAPQHATALRKITAVIQWSFYYTPRYTRVITLLVKGVSIKATVTVTCHGRGCPYAKRTMAVPQRKGCGPRGRSICPSGDVKVSRTFKNHRLAVGTTITVMVSRPGWTAKYYTFTVRPAQGPIAKISCMAPGRTRPGVGCTP